MSIDSTIKRTACISERTKHNNYRHGAINEKAYRIFNEHAAAGFSDVLIQHINDLEKYDLSTALSDIEILDLAAAKASEDNQWIQEAEKILNEYRTFNLSYFNENIDYSVTQACLLPVIHYINDRLLRHFAPSARRISVCAIQTFAFSFMNRLAFIADDVFLTFARNYEKNFTVHYWKNNQITNAAQPFLDWIYNEGIFLIMDEYPVLMKKIVQFSEIHIRNFIQFIVRFEENTKEIGETFSISDHDLYITDLACDLSDAHNSGQSVIKIKLQNGQSIYYKPRSMTIDQAWHIFTQTLTNNQCPIALYAPTVIDKTDYGYMEDITYQNCTCEEQVQQFYKNAGGLCCIVSILGGSDFHHENLIAKKTIPVLVDIETLITPIPKALYGISDELSNNSYTHVGRTLFLQHWVGNTPSASRDIGGFTSSGADNQNIPQLAHQKTDAAEAYIDAFVDGFSLMYRFLLTSRKKALEQNWLSVFSACQFRYVFRRTALYYNLNKHFYSAMFLRDIKFFESATFRLGAGILLNFDKEDSQKMWGIVTQERKAAQNNDIAYFFCKGNEDALYVVDGLCLNHFFRDTPIELAQNNLRSMSTDNLIREIHYIKLNLETCRSQKNNLDFQKSLSYDFKNCRKISIDCANRNLLILEIHRLIETIDRFSIKEDGFDYYAPMRNRQNARYNIENLSNDLYSGVLGILIAYAGFAKITENFTLKDKIFQKIEEIYFDQFSLTHHILSTNPNFTQGASGFIQACIILSKIFEDSFPLQFSINIAENLPLENIKRNKEFDFFGGLSGMLYYFGKLYEITPTTKLLAKITDIADLLMQRSSHDATHAYIWKSAEEYQPLTGLAHGQSGVAIALLSAWNLTGINEYLRASHSILNYEKECYSKTQQNWFDYRKFNVSLRAYAPSDKYSPRFMHGYCSGAPGIGISRIIANKQLGGPVYDNDLNAAISYCKNHTIISNDSLCCGTGAWIDLLIESSFYYNDTTLLQHAKKIALAMINSAKDSDYILSNLDNTADISLFKGYAGVAYQLMRLVDPHQLPSIII